MCGASPICVAIIDDDESLCRSLGRLLRTTSVQAVAYSSAESFLEDAKRRHFDCIVLDILLSGMSGLELNQRLKSAGSAIPVIFNTAHDEPEIRRRAFQSGCAAYLLKTDPGEIMLAAIRKAVRPAGANDSVNR